VTTEFDLTCATCGGSLTRRTVPGDAFGVDVGERVPVAECIECGGRHVPEQTLERVN
jgi:hypothetical protein